MEIMPGHSGTDAYGMQLAAAGIPCFVLGIPLRYMHTPVEVVAPIDILRTGRLLSEFIARLEPGFLDRITWDDGHA
jgi:endoglucanase